MQITAGLHKNPDEQEQLATLIGANNIYILLPQTTSIPCAQQSIQFTEPLTENDFSSAVILGVWNKNLGE